MTLKIQWAMLSATCLISWEDTDCISLHSVPDMSSKTGLMIFRSSLLISYLMVSVNVLCLDVFDSADLSAFCSMMTVLQIFQPPAVFNSFNSVSYSPAAVMHLCLHDVCAQNTSILQACWIIDVSVQGWMAHLMTGFTGQVRAKLMMSLITLTRSSIRSSLKFLC